MKRFCLWLLTASTLACTLAGRAARADAEGDLKARWSRAVVVTKVPTFTDCSESFTDNAVPAGGLPRGNGMRFGAGEIANVDKLDVTWTRIDLWITFLEPYRVTWKDGPFTLYDQRRCRVQLKLELPRDVRKDATKANAAIGALLEGFDGEKAARQAPGYNARRVEPYPANWEKTRAEYEAWHAARLNAAIDERIDTLLREAQDAIDRGRDDDAYLKCFGKGARSRSYQSFSSCDALLGSYFVSSGSCDNQRGFDDGQRLAWTTGAVRALAACRVATPPGAR